MKDTAVITVAFNKSKSLDACLHSVRSNVGCSFDIFVIDNCSTELIQPIAKKYKAKYLRLSKNYYASRAVNIGFTKFHILKKYRNLLIMGSDVRLEKRLISKLNNTLNGDPNIAITGPGHYDILSNKLLSFGIMIDKVTSLIRNFADPSIREGMNHFHSLYMIKTRVFASVAGFNHTLFPMIYEEPDLGERCKAAGYTILTTPTARIWHSLDELFVPRTRDKKLQRAQRLFNSYPKAYLFFRNRLLYMRLYSNALQFLIFLLFIFPAITLWYMRSMAPQHILVAFTGIMHGLFFAVTKDQKKIQHWNKQLLNI